MTVEKSVDESWKDDASTEKETLQETGKEVEAPHEHGDDCGCGHEQGDAAEEVAVNFTNYVTSLGFQALIFMGAVPNPMTNEITKNLEQAKFLVDTLAMIKEKTAGNLSKQEEDLLGATCYELQLKFVEISKEPAVPEGGGANA